MLNSILINGQPGEQIAVTDRALHYGDGVFETVAVFNGVPRLWDKHLKRLLAGCERLNLPAPDVVNLHKEVTSVGGDGDACVVKIIISRGSGGRGYRPPDTVAPTRLVMRYPYPDYPAANAQEGIALRICDTPLGCNPRLAGIKHLNRLEQVLARSEWQDENIAEGLMCDGNGHLIDGTMSNLFLVIDGAIYTPELSRCGVEGVMRSAVIEVARGHSIPVHIVPIPLARIKEANELFITNALIGIWPVKQCEELHYVPGPITSTLQKGLSKLLGSSHA